jgi:peptide/nickel transport system permease protein
MTAPRPALDLTEAPAQEAASRFRAVRLPRSPKVVIGLLLLALFLVLAVIGPMISPYSPDYTNLHGFMHKVLEPGTGTNQYNPPVYTLVPLSPTAGHWLGTTGNAQDVWSQLLSSIRATLLVGVLAAVISTALSILVGVSAGYLGGISDDLLSLLANVFLSIPGLALLVVLAGFILNASTGVGGGGSILLIAIIVAITGWAYSARVLRAQTLSLRNQDFVEAARVSGESPFRIIVVEVLPNLVPIVASSFLFTTIYAIGAYTALAFLGLVAFPPGGPWSLGTMMYWAFQANGVQTGYWWWWAPPGMFVALMGMAFALLNFGIDEFINPRLRAAGLTRKAARRAGISLRSRLGYTPVVHVSGGRRGETVAGSKVVAS